MDSKMKARIKELAEQAGLSHMPSNYPDMADLYKGADFELEKFAELIVQRTLAIVEAHTEIFQSAEARAMVEHIKQSVKTDFGVKE